MTVNDDKFRRRCSQPSTEANVSCTTRALNGDPSVRSETRRGADPPRDIDRTIGRAQFTRSSWKRSEIYQSLSWAIPLPVEMISLTILREYPKKDLKIFSEFAREAFSAWKKIQINKRSVEFFGFEMERLKHSLNFRRLLLLLFRSARSNFNRTSTPYL